jgi:hypothetical protein
MGKVWLWAAVCLAVVSAGACSGKISSPGGGGPGARGAGKPGQGASEPGGSTDGTPDGDDPSKGGSDPAAGGAGADDELDTTGVAECEQRALPGQPLRRLSSQQYANTLGDLFGEELAAPLLQGSRFPATVIEAGFINDAEANTVNTDESNAIEDNAERIAALVLADPERYARALLPCSLKAGFSDGEVDACIDAFIADFGLRAYRRPLTAAETTIARGLYDGLRGDQGALPAWSALLQFFVQSPALLYRVERGKEAPPRSAGAMPPTSAGASGLLRLTDYEMATRLSYFFLDSMPDPELFSAAAAGELSTPGQVATQARRLMTSPRFAAVLEGFHRDWLRLYELERSSKDPGAFPFYSAEVQQSLLQEIPQRLRHVLDDAEGNIATLLGDSTSPVNSTLAELYGVDAPGAGPDTWVPVELPDRRGLLTLASVMATLAEPDRTNPIHRGAFFQKEVLCNQLPAFPANLDTATPLLDTSMLPTARERLAPLLQNGSCMGCHSLFNPTGLAFENYDAAGQWREQENGAEIDASGTIALDGSERAFESPLELAEQLANSQQVRDCYALQWYRAALGRREFEQDACSLALAQQAAAESGGDLRELLVAITQTDGFLYLLPVENTP